MAVYLRREKKWVSSRWNSLGTITNSIWVLKLNAYETMEWSSPLRMGVSSKFHFISDDMAVLETTLWNSPLGLALHWEWVSHPSFFLFHITWQSWKQRYETPHWDWPNSSFLPWDTALAVSGAPLVLAPPHNISTLGYLRGVCSPFTNINVHKMFMSMQTSDFNTKKGLLI